MKLSDAEVVPHEAGEILQDVDPVLHADDEHEPAEQSRPTAAERLDELILAGLVDV